MLEDDAGTPRLLVVGNRLGGGVVADVLVPPGVALRDPFEGRLLQPRQGVIDVALAPHQVRLLTVI